MQTGKIGFGAIISSAQRKGMIVMVNELSSECSDYRGMKLTVLDSAPEITGIMADSFGKPQGVLADPNHIITNYVDEKGRKLSKRYPADKIIPQLDLVGWSKSQVIENLTDFVTRLVKKCR